MSPHEFTRAVLYIRVSTDKQAEHGHSLDAQREKLMAYADRFALQVVDVIVEGGESAGNLNRPGLQRALELAREGAADVLVATKGDRVFRSVRDQLNVLAELEAAGVNFALADDGEDFDTTTPAGELLMTMRAAVAQYERKLAGQRTREGMAAAKAKGIRLGRPPVGMQVERDENGKPVKRGSLVVADAGRIALGQRAATMQLSGKSLRAIAEAFTAEGIPTPNGGAAWYAPAIARLMKAAAIAA